MTTQAMFGPTPITAESIFANPAIYFLIIVLLVIGAFIIVSVIQHFISISQELQRIKIEIGRTHGKEKRRWIRRRRRLLWSLLPFVKY